MRAIKSKRNSCNILPNTTDVLVVEQFLSREDRHHSTDERTRRTLVLSCNKNQRHTIRHFARYSMRDYKLVLEQLLIKTKK